MRLLGPFACASPAAPPALGARIRAERLSEQAPARPVPGSMATGQALTHAERHALEEEGLSRVIVARSARFGVLTVRLSAGEENAYVSWP